MPRVMIVDDDEGVRLMLRILMEKLGHEVVEAENGHEAIKLIGKQIPALVILDIIMPEKEGLETILELRNAHPSLPIIAISGGGRIGSQSYLDDALKLGASKVFSKPFDLDDIRKAALELIRAD